MPGLYLLNILVVFVLFRLGANFDVALYVNMIISSLQCVVNVIYAKKTYHYPVNLFVKDILVPCCFASLVIFLVMTAFVNLLGASVLRFFMSVLLAESVIILCGYFIVLNKAEKQKVQNFAYKILHKEALNLQ